MKKVHYDLIKLLEENNTWITSKELAKHFKCTTRTIRNRIARINNQLGETIESSNKGYKLIIVRDFEILNKTDTLASQIFLEIMKNSDTGTNLFDLSEKLYVSESTIYNNINNLRYLIRDEPIKIEVEDNNIKLTGSENAKRKFLVSLMYNENDLYRNIKYSIQQSINDIPLGDIEEIIFRNINNKGLYINQYKLENITLHLVVSISRIREGNIISKTSLYQKELINLEKEIKIAINITNEVSDRYNISFPKYEMYQLALQFIGIPSQTMDNQSINTSSNYLEPKITTSLKKILKKVKEIYLVDFNNEAFIEQLSIHVHGLYLRANFNNYTRNSSLWDIKINYPIIYDISVYIASELQKILEIKLNEDEIAFIALHIGSYLEGRNYDSINTINVLIIADDYQKLRKRLVTKISKVVPDYAQIKSTTLLSDEYFKEFDLIVSTYKRHIVKYPGAIYINTFVSSKDIEKINFRIKSLYKNKLKESVFELLDKYIPDILYINQLDSEEFDKNQVIELMYMKMKSESFVDNNFYKGVLTRESLAPTSFPSGVAVPHPIELNGLKNGIAILTLQEPIKWGTQDIKMVAMVSIKQNNAKEFNQFFELFVDILSDEYNIKKLTDTDGFDDFILKLRIMINNKIDTNYGI